MFSGLKHLYYSELHFPSVKFIETTPQRSQKIVNMRTLRWLAELLNFHDAVSCGNFVPSQPLKSDPREIFFCMNLFLRTTRVILRDFKSLSVLSDELGRGLKRESHEKIRRKVSSKILWILKMSRDWKNTMGLQKSLCIVKLNASGYIVKQSEPDLMSFSILLRRLIGHTSYQRAHWGKKFMSFLFPTI